MTDNSDAFIKHDRDIRAAADLNPDVNIQRKVEKVTLITSNTQAMTSL